MRPRFQFSPGSRIFFAHVDKKGRPGIAERQLFDFKMFQDMQLRCMVPLVGKVLFECKKLLEVHKYTILTITVSTGMYFSHGRKEMFTSQCA